MKGQLIGLPVCLLAGGLTVVLTFSDARYQGHPDYQLGNWLKKQGFPKHLLGWPLVLAPLVSVVQAGLGLLWHELSSETAALGEEKLKC